LHLLIIDNKISSNGAYRAANTVSIIPLLDRFTDEEINTLFNVYLVPMITNCLEYLEKRNETEKEAISCAAIANAIAR
jgi:hypothetical protein